MDFLFSRAPVIVDTAPPPPRSLPFQKPTRVFSKDSAGTAAQALNTTLEGVDATLRNVSSNVAAAVNSTAAVLREAAGSAASSVQQLSSTTTAIPWTEELNKMTTTSVSERASHLSLVHMFAWFLLFATLTMTTVVLLNWCLRSSQSAAEDRDTEEEEEMPAKVFVLPSSSSTQGTLAEGTSSASSSSVRLLASRGNLARQHFLESRKANATVKNYGGTDTV